MRGLLSYAVFLRLTKMLMMMLMMAVAAAKTALMMMMVMLVMLTVATAMTTSGKLVASKHAYRHAQTDKHRQRETETETETGRETERLNNAHRDPEVAHPQNKALASILSWTNRERPQQTDRGAVRE